MSGPAAAPVKPDATMTHSEQNEIFGPPAGGAAAPPPPPAAPAAAAPPPAAPAAAPAALPAADPNAAAPDAGTAPAGEGTASPAAAAAPETPAEVEARVLKGVVEKLLAGKPAAPAAPTQIPDPPHIKQARDVMALTEERYNEIYDGFVEGARTGKDPNGYRKAEQLASLRANAPYHVWQYDQTLETRRTASAGIERQQKAEADAALAQLNANPETKDWQTYRKTMGRLAAADAAAEAAGLEPAYADTVSLYRAAKAIDTGGKSPALPPAAAAAKAALTSATPSPRGGPAAQPAITAPPRDAWLDEALAGPADPFKV